MSELKLRQLQFESDGWKRMIAFISEENINCKNRISEILKKDFNTELLGSLEHFQTGFLHEDSRLSLLRNEVAEFDQLLVREVFGDGQIINNVKKKMKRIKNNIAAAENAFSQLKSDFNNCLSEQLVN